MDNTTKQNTQHFYQHARFTHISHSLGLPMHQLLIHYHRKLPYLLILLLLIPPLLLTTSPVIATPEPKLELYLFDSTAPSWEPLAEPIFFSQKTYDIAVTIENNVTFAYNVTLTIGTYDETYQTTPALPYITITAPTYTPSNNEVIITATKEGYETAILSVTILKGTLEINTDRVTVQEDESFSVIITNEEGKNIPDCLIYLDCVSSNSCSSVTNENGIAYLPAPAVQKDTQINIIAVKDGYACTTTQIRVENTQAAFIGDVSTEFQDILPVIFAVISVIAAIIIVTVRNRHDNHRPEVKIHPHQTETPKIHHQQNQSPSRQKPPITPTKPPIPTNTPAISNNTQSQETTSNGYSPYNKTENRSPHIEEIRIHVKNHEKKTKNISTEDKIDRLIPRHKEDRYEWFNGKDDIRYKIDSLTGEIDEQRADKWFEGIDEIRCKVDEKLKKNNRKKKENN